MKLQKLPSNLRLEKADFVAFEFAIQRKNFKVVSFK